MTFTTDASSILYGATCPFLASMHISIRHQGGRGCHIFQDSDVVEVDIVEGDVVEVHQNDDLYKCIVISTRHL